MTVEENIIEMTEMKKRLIENKQILQKRAFNNETLLKINQLTGCIKGCDITIFQLRHHLKYGWFNRKNYKLTV